MISLNYTNSVIKGILKENFNAKTFIQKYKDLCSKISDFNSDSYGTSAFLKDDNSKSFTLTVPSSSPNYVYFKTKTDKQKVMNSLVGKNIQILNSYEGNIGVMLYMSCKKMLINVNDNLDYSLGKPSIYVYFSEKLDIYEFLNKLEELEGRKVTFFELPSILKEKFEPVLEKYKKLLNKENKNFNSDIANTNIQDKKDNMKDIDVGTPIDKGLTTDNPNDYYTAGHHSMRLSPQYLVRTTNYLTIPAVKSTVENSLIGMEKQEEKNVIKWLSIDTLCDIVGNTADGRANEKVEIITDDRFNKIKNQIPELKRSTSKNKDELKQTALNKETNKNKKMVSSVESLGGINNNTLGYSIVKNLSVWPVEILSPIILANMDPAIKWGRDGDMSSKDILNEIFGIENIKKSLISYPENSEKFFDSYLAIPAGKKHKQMKISSKAGLAGVGAPASLSSLSDMLLENDNIKSNSKVDTERIITEINGYNFRNQTSADDFVRSAQLPLSIYGKTLLRLYPAETVYLLLFGVSKPSLHTKIMNSLCKYGFFGIDLRQINGSLTSFINRTNSALNLTDAIMKLLNYQKYDISQVNATPRMEGGKFWYEYNIQYPAHFTGTVKMEKRGQTNGSIAFHIMPN